MQAEEVAAKESPDLGPVPGLGLACRARYWPVSPTADARAVTARRRRRPIVVVGTTRDPATPYEWARARWPTSSPPACCSPATATATPPTARANKCIDRAVDRYYLKGTVPEDGLRCWAPSCRWSAGIRET